MEKNREESIQRRYKNVRNSKTFKNLLKTYSLDKKKILDIGCSWGEFLDHFGPGSLGVTISQEESDWAQNKGINIINCDIEADHNELPLGCFDVLFANNLFEHLESPHNFLLSIKKYLNRDGLLILGVPCVPKISSLMHWKKFKGSLGSAHINFFNRYTLSKTVERAGWDIINIRGFRIFPSIIDNFLNSIYPHFYVVAIINKNFAYPGKRQKEVDWKHSSKLN